MKKELCTKFCGVLISYHEVMKLQSFESDLSDVIPRMYKTIYHWVSLHIFVNFMKNKPVTLFDGRYDHFL